MFNITLNRVRDKITVKEGNEKIILRVDKDPRIIAIELKTAQKALSEIKDDSSTVKKITAAKSLSEAMFGEEQTKTLFRFYSDDPGCVVTICGMYFEKRLAKLITKAQKKQR